MLEPQEKRRLIVKLLRDAADVVEASHREPVGAGEVIWDVLMEIERQAEAAADERRHRPPAA